MKLIPVQRHRCHSRKVFFIPDKERVYHAYVPGNWREGTLTGTKVILRELFHDWQASEKLKTGGILFSASCDALGYEA